MKRGWIGGTLLAGLILVGASLPRPHIERFVFDREHDLTPEQESALDSLFRAHEARTTNEIALVTTPDLRGRMDMATFAAEMGDSLKVGKRGKNNGVVIAFSMHMRQVYIAAGVGTENVLTEERCYNIVDSVMMPRFKEHDFYGGLLDGGRAVTYLLELPGHPTK